MEIGNLEIAILQRMILNNKRFIAFVTISDQLKYLVDKFIAGKTLSFSAECLP